MALDKNRPIYFAMDHTSGKDRTICNNIVNKLKNAGLNVVSSNIGPNQMYQNMVRVYNSGKTNAIIFNLFNGVDPSNIREVALHGNDNRGRTVNSRGNTIVLGWFYDSCDPVHENGRCYKSVRGSETGGRLNNPGQYMKDNNIIGLCCSSDMHTKMANADYTGDKIAQEFINLFGETSEETPTTEEVAEASTVTEPEKVITSIVTDLTYSTPDYMKVIASKTDSNGAFLEELDLPYKGDYIVRLNFAGDREHAPVTRTIHVANQKGTLFQEKLLHMKTTTTYSDGSSTVLEDGEKTDLLHTKTVTQTQTYENGALKNLESVTVYNDKINIEDRTETSSNLVLPTTSTEGTEVSTITGKKDPWFDNIPLVNGKPDVAHMQTRDGWTFEEITNKQYTISKQNLFDMCDQESQTLQLKGCMSKYTAFPVGDKTTSKNYYVVLKREIWNAIEESIHFYVVKGQGIAFPETYVIDMVNKRTKCGDTWINWKASECRNYIVRDRQNTNYTCGPTACSVCTQVLHNYRSEQKLQRYIHATSADGSAPDTHARKLRDLGFKATLYSGIRKAVSHLKRGFPCTWHIYGHYYALCDILDNEEYVLASNSSGHGVNGWAKTSTVGRSAYGQAVLVESNWALTDLQKQKRNTFFNNMGGKWEKPQNTNEGIRQAS